MTTELQIALGRLLRPLRNRVSSLIGRAVLTYLKEGEDFQIVQAERLADELGDLERYGEYGLASRPPKGAELIVVSVGGVRSHGAVIACEHREFRLKLTDDGEVALYDDLGQVVYLKRDGIRIETELKVDIVAPTVNVTAASANISGNATVEGDAVVKGNVKLGGANPVKFVMLADGSPSTRVKAL